MFVGDGVGISLRSCNAKPTFWAFFFMIYTILKNINLFLASFNKSTNLHQINYKIIVNHKQNSVQHVRCLTSLYIQLRNHNPISSIKREGLKERHIERWGCKQVNNRKLYWCKTRDKIYLLIRNVKEILNRFHKSNFLTCLHKVLFVHCPELALMSTVDAKPSMQNFKYYTKSHESNLFFEKYDTFK